MTKVKQPSISPNPQAAPLAVDPTSLVVEWRKLDEQYAQLRAKAEQANQMITLANNTIAEAETAVKVLTGQLEILARIFNGMGINPNEYEASGEKISAEPTVLSPVEKPLGAEVDDSEEFTEKKRFNVVKRHLRQ